MKIHYPSCSAVKQMKDSNKAYTEDFDGAVASGYVPCKKCNPTGKNTRWEISWSPHLFWIFRNKTNVPTISFRELINWWSRAPCRITWRQYWKAAMFAALTFIWFVTPVLLYALRSCLTPRLWASCLDIQTKALCSTVMFIPLWKWRWKCVDRLNLVA